jgi:hypothetical protein
MLRGMKRRTPLLRSLALVWAALQLAMPAVSSLADARLAAAAGEPVAHVESTTTSTCPVIHAPDCGICRYLSSAAPASDAAAVAEVDADCEASSSAAIRRPAFLTIVLPDGRAPPGI